MLSYFSEFSAYALLIDFFWASVFLFIGQICRMKIKLLQQLFIPASVVAGLAGLLLGKEFLGVVEYSTQTGYYPTVLIIMLFATIMLGHDERKENVFKKIWNTRAGVFNAYAWECIQFGIAILLGYFLVHAFFPKTMDGVGMLMSAGFAGGYGYGGAVGSALEGFGLESGTGLGMTFATLGMLVGILGGMILINIASRKGYLSFTKKLAEIPEDELKGIKDVRLKESIGTMTMNSNAIDPLGWHVVLVLICAGLGWLTNYYVKQFTGTDIPALCLALIWGLLMQTLFEKIGMGERVDKKTVTHLGSTITDYLVFFGFVTIQKSVITTYLPLILALAACGMAINVFYMMVICPRTMPQCWFEKGIIWFGLFSGVSATGITLLRVVDPENRSGALEDLGLAMVPMSFTDLFLIGVVPIFLGQGHTLLAGIILFLAGGLFLAVLKATGCVHPSLAGKRDGK